mmetsp:Transcript_25611/g.50102  ORF Transcript_25611/g.50102 Transcript_25611/m.50102 type:complete len:137 (+) Transcript_25611:443-853(+)
MTPSACFCLSVKIRRRREKPPVSFIHMKEARRRTFFSPILSSFHRETERHTCMKQAYRQTGRHQAVHEYWKHACRNMGIRGNKDCAKHTNRNLKKSGSKKSVTTGTADLSLPSAALQQCHLLAVYGLRETCWLLDV